MKSFKIEICIYKKNNTEYFFCKDFIKETNIHNLQGFGCDVFKVNISEKLIL